jgi:glycerophosphoryl diester phosphodiesterase
MAMPIRPLLLGHRGARGEKSVPENTLASFDLALARDCDGFEFDVRLSADRQPVICHDATSGRFIIEQCTARSLALPLLSEVIERYRNSAFLDIELKVIGLESTVMDLLRLYPPERGYVVSSFIPEVLSTLREMSASIPLGLICDSQNQFHVWPGLAADYAILHRKLAQREVITQIKGEGKKILVWTVNSPREIQKFKEYEVDGIISDYPERLGMVKRAV